MDNAAFRTLRGGTVEEHPRDSITIGDARLERIATIDKEDGHLEQGFIITYGTEQVAEAWWEFPREGGGSKDNPLKLLDHHWGRMKKEFGTLLEQADFFYHVKAKNEEASPNPLVKDFLKGIAGPLLNMQIPDEDFAEGRIDNQYYPLTVISQRLTALRIAAFPEKMDMESDDPALKETKAICLGLDPFEKEIMALDGHVAQTMHEYNKYLGDDGADDEDDGLQLTASPEEDDEDWRGNEHPATEEEYAEASPWQEAQSSGEADDGPEDGLDEGDEFPLTERLELYMNYLVDFTNSANNLWMDAVQRIHDHKPVTKNSGELRYMQNVLKEAEEAYKEFKEAAKAELPHTYDLQPVFDLIEDEQAGPTSRMHKLLDMASKPSRLETMIKKHLNIQRDKGDALGK